MDSNTSENEAATAAEPDVDEVMAGESVEASPVELSPIDGSSRAQKPNEASNLKLILDLPVDIQAELGHSQMSIREVLKLGQGSVIQLDRSAGSSADIIVNGKLIGQGDVVVVDENFGIRITKLISPEERLESL